MNTRAGTISQAALSAANNHSKAPALPYTPSSPPANHDKQNPRNATAAPDPTAKATGASMKPRVLTKRYTVATATKAVTARKNGPPGIV